MSYFETKKRERFLTEAVYQEQDAFYQNELSEAELAEWNLRMKNPDLDYRIRQSWTRPSSAIKYLILRYSAGEDINKLREPCQAVFDEFARHYTMFPDDKMNLWEADAYQYMMWLLGLAYLFNLPHYLPQITSWYDPEEDGADDPLVRTLLLKLGCQPLTRDTGSVMSDKTYLPLFQALEASDQASAQTHIASYLKTWYKGMKNCYWYNRHKSKFAIHFGYWSFEAGLVTVLLGLDDTAYREMLHYPKDLVVYAKAQGVAPYAAAQSLQSPN